MIIASFLPAGLLILKYRDSLSISSNHSSHALPVLSCSSVGRNGSVHKFLVSVVTIAILCHVTSCDITFLIVN